ncbi:MAG TPA: LacI family DNA-binding transcriptional regulator [Bryobacteraceae bacterium]|nr:LacI family DNA-binding transcriptional regulator [Bryobacteraceae bacterium]
MASNKKPIYREVCDAIRGDIEARRYGPGERLPSDAELAKRFGTSRLTVIRALRDLEAEAVVQRKAGSGTFVRAISGAANSGFGILMPDLGEGEVFEPVSHGIAHAAEAAGKALLWGDLSAAGREKEQHALELCRYFISRQVAGVFFSPVELTSSQDAVNQRIASELHQAGIAIVLVDRCICPFPERSQYDLVGIDNRRAGYRMTKHLLAAGCSRLAYAYRPGSAPTVAARLSGFREALWTAGIPETAQFTFESADMDEGPLSAFMGSARPDGFVCANDLTAAKLMHSLLRLGVRIPEDVRMVGINDVKYARFLPVPLTTLRQPCEQMGFAAMAAMLDRIEKPDMPAREILLDCELVVRQSCGAKSANGTAAI